MKKISLILLVILLMFLPFILFGHLNIKTGTEQQCGLEQVIPCVLYDVPIKTDVLNKYRTYFITSNIALLIVFSGLYFSLRKK
jgi:hypothetical protein